jgi:hypothetical protein
MRNITDSKSSVFSEGTTLPNIQKITPMTHRPPAQKFLLLCTLSLLNLFYPVSPSTISFTPLKAVSSDTDDSWMPKVTPIHSRSTQSGTFFNEERVYVFVSESSAVIGRKMVGYRDSGQRIFDRGGLGCNNSLVESKGDTVWTMGYNGGCGEVVKISQIGGVYSTSTIANNGGSGGSGYLSWSDGPDTTLVYATPVPGQTTSAVKFDFTTMAINLIGPSIVMSDNKIVSASSIDNAYAIFSSSITYFIRKSDLVVTAALKNNKGSSVVASIKDNLRSQLILSLNSMTVLFASYFDQRGPNLFLFAQIDLPYIGNLLANVGQTNFAMVLGVSTITNNATLYLMDKYLYTVPLIMTNNYIRPVYRSLQTGDCLFNSSTGEDRCPFLYVSNYNGYSNLQSIRLNIPRCQNYSPNGPCAMCPSDKYGYKLKDTDTYCTHYSGFPAGFGAPKSGQTVTSCSDPNCVQCNTLSSTCEECKPSYLLANGSCYSTPSQLPRTFGPLSTYMPSYIIGANCTVANCDNCTQDINQCTQCSRFYALLSPTSCASLDTLIGYGPNPLTGFYEPCTTPNCKSCPQTIQICTQCRDEAGQKRYLLNGQCFFVNELPNGVGIDPDNDYAIVPCADPQCDVCRELYFECKQCKRAISPDPQYYLYNSGCVLSSTLPDGIGANLTSLTTQPCQSPNCQSCQSDYTICTRCQPDYVSSNGQCILISSIPDGYGIDPSTGLIVQCSDPQCRNCRANYTECTECRRAVPPDPQYYLYKSTCVLPSTLPDGIGANTTSLIAEPCQDVNCQKCQENIINCTQCRTAQPPNQQYSLYNSSCVPVVNIPPGYGTNLENNTIVRCKDTNCINCSTNYSNCTACNTSQGWYLGNDSNNNSQCQHATLSPTFPPGYGPDPSVSRVVACNTTRCLSCPSVYTVCTQCQSAYYLLNSSLCVDYDHIPDYFGIDLSTDIMDVARCTVNRCRLCKDDRTKCTQCDPLLYVDLKNNLCLTEAEYLVKTGYGLVTNNTSRQILPCQDSNCKNCTADYTKCSICNSSYLVSTLDNKCYSNTSIPDGQGIVLPPNGTAPTQISPCTSPNCTRCTTDFTRCTLCSPTVYFDSTNQLCTAIIPPGYGIRNSTKEILPCVDSVGCMDCSPDYSSCSVCKSGYYRDIATSKCYPDSGIPDGLGKNPTTPEDDIRRCLDSYCQKCKEDYRVCTLCQSSFYLFVTDTKCYQINEFPAKTGIVKNSSILTIAPCRDAGCIDCVADNSMCKRCGFGYYYDSNRSRCFTEIPAGYGINRDSTINEILPCKQSNCKRCTENYKVCNACNDGYFLDVEFQSCTNTIPDGKGRDLNSSLNEIRKCIDSVNCSKCAQDYTKCTQCKSSLYLNSLNYTCVSKDKIPRGFGIDSLAPVLTIRPCSDPNCDLCTDNYQACTQCNSISIWVPAFAQCYPLNKTLPRYGRKVGQNKPPILVPCEDPRCVDCYDDYRFCKECERGFGANRFGQCEYKPNKAPLICYPVLVFGRKVNTYAFYFPGKQFTINILFYFFVSLRISSDRYIYDQSRFSLYPENNGFSVNIDLDEDFGRGELVIDNLGFGDYWDYRLLEAVPTLTPEEREVLDSMPFPLKGTVYSSASTFSTASSTALETFTKVAVATSLVSNIILPFDPLSRAAAFGMDRLYGQITLTGLQSNGANIETRTAARFINGYRSTVISILDFNLFEDRRGKAKCQPSEAMILGGVDCDFLVNYGDKVITLGIILGFMILVDILFAIIYSRTTSMVEIPTLTNSLSYYVYIILKTFGLRFFIAKMDGMLIESLFYSFISLSTLTTQNLASFFISLGFLGYIVGQITFCVVFARKLYAVVSCGQENFTAMDLATVYENDSTIKGYGWRIVSLMWTGIRADQGPKAAYYPIVSMIRMVLLSLIVGMMSSLVTSMALLVVLVEASFLAFSVILTKMCPRGTLIENTLEYIGSIFNIIFYISSAIASTSIIGESRLYSHYLMYSLLAYFVLCQLMVIYSVVMTTVRLIRWMLTNKAPTPEKSRKKLKWIFPKSRPDRATDHQRVITESDPLQSLGQSYVGDLAFMQNHSPFGQINRPTLVPNPLTLQRLDSSNSPE